MLSRLRCWLMLGLMLGFSPFHAHAASHFDGADSVVTIPSNAATSVTAFTAGCWTRYASTGEGGLGRVLAKNAEWNIRLSTGVYRFITEGWSTTQGTWSIVSQAVDTWAHVVVSYDAGSPTNVPVMYLNGVASTLTPISAADGTFTLGPGTLYIGNVNGSGRTWDGELGECFFYNRILSALEVMQVKVKGPTSLTTGRVSYWPLGVFGGRNYTSTTGLDGAETAITQVGPHPPLSYASQGSTP